MTRVLSHWLGFMTCPQTTKKGKPCKNPVAPGQQYCAVHSGIRPKPPKRATP